MAQIGAAIGREFSYEVLQAVADRPDDQLRDAIDQLVAAGLISAGEHRRKKLSSSSTPSCRTPPMACCCAGGARAYTAPLLRFSNGKQHRHCRVSPSPESVWRCLFITGSWQRNGERAQLHSRSGETGGNTLCPPRGDQPVLASSRPVRTAAGKP